MATLKTAKRGRVKELIEKYGKCVELVPMDPNFQEITVGLYVKDGIGTVWTFSRKPGVEGRIREIRDQLVALGGMLAIDGTHDKTKFACGELHGRPLKFLTMRAVEKAADYRMPEGKTKDLRSGLMLDFEVGEIEGRWVYRPTAEGEAPNAEQRLRAVTGGMVRYGEMEKLDGEGVVFPCGYRHDELVRLILPYARNVSGSEDMLASGAMRGQMTTGTLGFTPPS